jgi:hypothetical protein
VTWSHIQENSELTSVSGAAKKNDQTGTQRPDRSGESVEKSGTNDTVVVRHEDVVVQDEAQHHAKRQTPREERQRF